MVLLAGGKIPAGDAVSEIERDENAMINRKKIPLAVALTVIAAAISGCGKPSHTPRKIDMERVALIRDEISTGAGGGGTTTSRPDPTGFATLTGSFKFAASAAGQFTTRPNLAVSGGDAAFCSQNGAPKSSALLVNSSGAVENVVIFLGDDLSKVEKPELWIHPSKAPGANTETVEFDQRNCVFLKPVVAMQVSQPLLILNSDGVGHNTKLDNSNPISEIVPTGGKLEYNHRKEERTPYPVSCNIHPWMLAHILVRDNGYFATTDENGQFSIENLPAGVDLNMKVWHEKVGFVQDVTVNGSAEKWSKKGFTLKLTPDQDLTLDVVLDDAPFK